MKFHYTYFIRQLSLSEQISDRQWKKPNSALFLLLREYGFLS